MNEDGGSGVSKATRDPIADSGATANARDGRVPASQLHEASLLPHVTTSATAGPWLVVRMLTVRMERCVCQCSGMTPER